MGNRLCLRAYPLETVNLIQFDGGLEREVRILKPTKVAEVMLDNPNHFVCNFGCVKAGRRVLPLPADEELESGNMYVILPMKKLRCVMSASDITCIQSYFQQHKHNSRAKKRKATFESTVFTVCKEKDLKDGLEKIALPKLEVDEIAQKELEKLRMGGCRYFKPMLHTIQESHSFNV